jgi:NADH dehydrogenase FAD-containing subunit
VNSRYKITEKKEKLVVLGSGWAANRFLKSIDKKVQFFSLDNTTKQFCFDLCVDSVSKVL